MTSSQIIRSIFAVIFVDGSLIANWVATSARTARPSECKSRERCRKVLSVGTGSNIFRPKTMTYIFEVATDSELLSVGVDYLTGTGVDQNLERAAIVLGALEALKYSDQWGIGSKLQRNGLPRHLEGAVGHAAHRAAKTYLEAASGDSTNANFRAFHAIASMLKHQGALAMGGYINQFRRNDKNLTSEERRFSAFHEAGFFRQASECTPERLTREIAKWDRGLCELAKTQSRVADELYAQLSANANRAAANTDNEVPNWALVLAAGVAVVVVAGLVGDYADPPNDFDDSQEHLSQMHQQMESTWAHVGATLFLD